MPKAARQLQKTLETLFKEFVSKAQPLENGSELHVLVDKKTGAQYCECHITAKSLITLGTLDVPLDPEEQPDYRANREIVPNHSAFLKMQDDAKNGRTFSNIVAEFTTEFDPEHPLKIIGGQHRFRAIREALELNVDEHHGIKVYLMLTMEQRLDVQLISNTNIAVAADLFDRMQETTLGPDLRQWCQKVGLLETGKDFADRRIRGGPISVQLARTFITNYYMGMKVKIESFANTSTVPTLCPSGQLDSDWESLTQQKPSVWNDKHLNEAGVEFAKLVDAQRRYFDKAKNKPKPDFPEKAMNPAVLAAWAFVAGLLHANDKRLKRHFAIRHATGKDPLNAAALAKGRHRSDPENYRGLGYRTDSRERGRFVELFFNQAEKGDGITVKAIEVAIMQFFAKQAQLEVTKAKAGATDATD